MPPVRLAAWLAALVVFAAQPAAQSMPHDDPTPQTLEEFRLGVERVLRETGVPGAGLALVRADRVEWAGGVGFADRDLRTPVTADTHFRVGSISKTFVAMALVQMAEDGSIDLETPLEAIAPEVAFENAWEATAPVRVIDLLQHTAGFDDMHFNETYNLDDRPDLPLARVLARNPRSRRSRWPPGTRMSYSNPGYGVAGYLIEKVAGEPYEDVIAREILDPLGMTTSSFRLTADDEPLLARGYDGRSGPPVPLLRIHLRPAGNLHSSPRELATFVQMLLGWGELGEAFVIDPEFLGNMERSQATLASAAGLRNGYGSGIFHMPGLPYPMLGHNGGIEGFLSSYAYSPSRDVGFVVLLNSTHSSSALLRISSLAVRYLKRGVEPPAKPKAEVGADVLARHEGYYHDTGSRNQVMAFLEWLIGGRTIVREGRTLFADPVFGPRVPIVPVSDDLFRLENEFDASRVFTVDADGAAILTGAGVYAERRPRWHVEVVRVPVMASVVLILSAIVALVAWVAMARRGRPRRFWALRIVTALAPLALFAPVVALSATPMSMWGRLNLATALAFAGPLSLPALALAMGALAVDARREGARRALVAYTLTVAAALLIVSAYLWYWGVFGIRLWSY